MADQDLKKCIELGRRFHAAAGLEFPFSEDDFRGSLEQIRSAGGLFTSERGMIGGLIAPSFINRSHLIAFELFWWAEDGKGVRLLRQFEKWAAQQGALEIRMSTLASLPGAERALRGYERVETGYRKAI